MSADPTTELGRIRAYLAERFPLAAYALLVALFHGAGSLAAVRLGGGEVRWWAALVVLLAFFHLRVFDEHKDFAKDAVSHPHRLLSRGVVTLPMLRRWALVAIVAEALLAAACGPWTFGAWAGVFLFTVAMRYEFGVGPILERNLLFYAVTHNPVVAGLALFIHASTSATWDARYLLFVLAASVGSLGFEIGRKTRQPDEEIAGVPSYSSVYGRALAGVMVQACVAFGLVFATLFTHSLSDSWLPLIPMAGGFVLSRALARADSPAKRVEAGASAALLGMFCGVGVAAW